MGAPKETHKALKSGEKIYTLDFDRAKNLFMEFLFYPYKILTGFKIYLIIEGGSAYGIASYCLSPNKIG
jgi:hypothetical protein